MRKLRFHIIFAIGILIAAFTLGLLYNIHAKETAHVDHLFQQQLDTAVDFSYSIRTYIKDNIRPLLLDNLPEGEFIPKAMSTSLIAREIFEMVKQQFSDVFIKFSSADPRNPINLAGEDEIEVIRYFNEYPNKDELKRELTINGTPYLANIRPMRMEKGCLKCHGDPADAPAKMIEIYGADKSFGWEMGKVIGLQTVAIPISVFNTVIKKEIRQDFFKVAVSLVLLLLAVVLIMRFTLSDQKMVGAALEKIEEKYRTILETIEDGYYEVDIAGNFTFFNDAFCQILGYSRSEMTGMNNRKYMDEKTASRVYQVFNKVFISGLPNKGFDYKAIRKDGTLRDVNVSVSLIRDKGGKITGFRGIARDETEKRRNEEALKLSEEKFRLMAETSIDEIFQLNMNGQFVYTSPSVEQITGYLPEEVISTSITNYVPESNLPIALELFNQVISGEPVKSHEFTLIKKDGTYTVVEVSAAPIVLDGKIIGIQGIGRDISERIKVQKALKESEEKFRLIVETSVDEIFWTDEKGTLTYISPGVKDLFGYEPDEVIGNNFTRYFPESELPKLLNFFDRYIFGEKIKNIETVSIRKDGTFVNLEINATSIFKEGKIVGIHGIARDVSEKVKAEKALRESQKNLESMFDAITEPAFLIDIEGIFIELNKTTAHSLCSTVDRLRGKNAFDFLPEDFAKSRKNKLEEVLRTGKEIQFEDIRFGRYVRNNFYPVLDDKNNVIRIAIFSKDIHDTKIAEDKLKESHEQLRNLTKHLMSVREQERIRIARGLHDELGQVLTAINLEVSAISNNLPETYQKLKSRAEATAELAVGAIRSIKRIIAELRPTLLDDLGLAEAIRWQVREYQSRMGTKFDIAIEPEDISLNDDLSIAVFRIFQESMTNAIRHSHATKISVRLRRTDAGIELKIKDNGIGITHDQVSHNGSFGIKGIRERAELFGGTIDISGKSGKGTTLVARFPV